MQKKYEETWESLSSRPIPTWFDQDKLGIFIHWGIYSVPAYAPKRREVEGSGLCYAEWYAWQFDKYEPYRNFHLKTYGEQVKYEDFAGWWKGELFDADSWMDLIKESGARYVVLTAKHHDGFCLWPSDYSWNWNTVDIGPHRDVVGELMETADRKNIKRGLYYSLLEWYHPYIKDPEHADYRRYASEKMIPQMKELVEKYKPMILFTDGEWATSSDNWKSKEFLSWLFNESSMKDEIVVNDRWGNDTRGKYGGYLTCEYGEVNSAAVEETQAMENLTKRKWEECRSISNSFGFNRNENIDDYLSEYELIGLLVNTVSKGGNLCLNIGPNADGTISPIYQERLLQLGSWLKINGEAIFETTAADFTQLPENAKATEKEDCAYLIFDRYPEGQITAAHPKITPDSKLYLLGRDGEIAAQCREAEVEFQLEPLFAAQLFEKKYFTIKIEF